MTESKYEQLLTKSEVADYLQVSVRTVERMIKAGKLKAYKFQTNVRLKKEEVDSYLESIQI
jgi:excisionase family DNA binding protein